MPCLWGQHNNSQIFLNVGIVDASAVNLTAAPPFGASFPNPQMFRALVDTGAQRTMISTNVVNALNLTPLGTVQIRGAGHTITRHNSYLFHIAFVIALPSNVGQMAQAGVPTQALAFLNPNPIHGAEIGLTSTGGSFDVLLGMDIIATGSLKIEGNGTFSFSF